MKDCEVWTSKNNEKNSLGIKPSLHKQKDLSVMLIITKERLVKGKTDASLWLTRESIKLNRWTTDSVKKLFLKKSVRDKEDTQLHIYTHSHTQKNIYLYHFLCHINIWQIVSSHVNTVMSHVFTEPQYEFFQVLSHNMNSSKYWVININSKIKRFRMNIVWKMLMDIMTLISYIIHIETILI